MGLHTVDDLFVEAQTTVYISFTHFLVDYLWDVAIFKK